MTRDLHIDPPAIVRPADDLADLAAYINAEHEAGEAATRQGLERFRNTGEALLRAKNRCGHGKWLPWLKANVKFGQTMASRYMRVAQHWDKLALSANLSDALRLLTEDEEEQEEKEKEEEEEGADSSGQEDSPPPAPAVIVGERWRVEQADALDFLARQEPGSIDLVFGSPPYEDARLYLEGGKNLGVARDTDEWVAWMVDVFKASLRVCKGLVAYVVAGRTQDYTWTASPALLIAALRNEGITLRNPPLYRRVGIPGSGGPDWLRNDYEWIVCATNGGPLPWSDNTAMGQPPKYEPGGDPSHRTVDGSRVNGIGYASMEDRENLGPHRARQRAGRVYQPPERANPGNVIDCVVGGGAMGSKLCHENEAPFPESLAEFFVKSFCPPAGKVCDPFSGSGTTVAVAVANGRIGIGCDLRASQVDIVKRRLSGITPPLFEEV